jgi:hypothetical protein
MVADGEARFWSGRSAVEKSTHASEEPMRVNLLNAAAVATRVVSRECQNGANLVSVPVWARSLLESVKYVPLLAGAKAAAGRDEAVPGSR